MQIGTLDIIISIDRIFASGIANKNTAPQHSVTKDNPRSNPYKTTLKLNRKIALFYEVMHTLCEFFTKSL
ncbi:hypothetical protein AMJ86_09400 [bacterium SM23_57]|nr:MAG: hypothetical protein AMJ86_09400 [bacterium SM23_57]